MSTVAPELAETSGRRHRRVWALAVVVVAAALVYGVVAGYRCWTHPTLLEDVGGGFAAAPQPVGAFPFYEEFAVPDEKDSGHEQIRLHRARVRFSANTAGATGDVLLCTRTDDPTGLGAQIGRAALNETCKRSQPVDEHPLMTYDPSRPQYLVLVVEVTHPGYAEVSSIAVDYTRGWRLHQHGFQRFGGEFSVRAR